MQEIWWVAEGGLDDDQKKIAALPAKDSYLITVPPGCVKRKLLLLRSTDYTLQKIYSGPDSLPILGKSVNAIHPLRFHYRLGHEICRVADAIFVGSQDEPLYDTALYNEKLRPSSAELVRCKTEDEQASLIVE